MGGCSALRCMDSAALSATAGQRGILSFRREYPPLNPPRERRGAFPLDPAHWQSLARRAARPAECKCGVHGFAMNPTSRYRYQPRPTPWGASDVPSAADCLRAAALLRSPPYKRGILSRERMPPLNPPRERQERFDFAPAPLTTKREGPRPSFLDYPPRGTFGKHCTYFGCF